MGKEYFQLLTMEGNRHTNVAKLTKLHNANVQRRGCSISVTDATPETVLAFNPPWPSKTPYKLQSSTLIIKKSSWLGDSGFRPFLHV